MGFDSKKESFSHLGNKIQQIVSNFAFFAGFGSWNSIGKY